MTSLSDQNSCTWYMLNIDKHLPNYKLSITEFNYCLSQFHRLILESWHHVKSRPPESIEEIYHEYLFDNMFICSNKKPLELQKCKLHKDKTKAIRIQSLFTSTGGQVTWKD